jgi:hypothetical protein
MNKKKVKGYREMEKMDFSKSMKGKYGLIAGFLAKNGMNGGNIEEWSINIRWISEINLM